MWKIKNIAAKNFMSFKAVSFAFQDKCYVVCGSNLQDGGQKSNGSGKTSFMDLVCVGLLGYTLSGRNTKECVAWDAEQSFFTVLLQMENIEHGLMVDIERKYYSNTRSAELVLLVNGETPKTIPTKKGVANGVDIKEGNKYIIDELLNIKEDDLLNYYLISEAHYNPFLQINTDQKLEVIARFTNTTAVDKTIAELEDALANGEVKVMELQNKIESATGYIQALEDTKGMAGQAKWEATQSEKATAIEQRIISVNAEIEAQGKRLLQHQETMNAIVLEPVDEATKAEIEKLANEANILSASGKKQKNEIEELIAEMKTFLAGLIECPKCAHKFNLESDADITEKDLEETKLLLTEVETSYNDNINTVSELTSMLYKIKEQEHDNHRKEKEKSSLARTIVSIEKQIDSYQLDIQKLFRDHDVIDAQTFADTLTGIDEQINQKKVDMDLYQEGIGDWNKALDTMRLWIDQFNDFRFYLGNKPLELICNLVNQYLALNGSDLNLQIEGYKKLKSGELRQALNPVVYRNWLNPKPYTQFSAGERVRLDISVDLAFAQLINASSKYGGLDFYANDELLSGLDSLGVANAAEAFNVLNKSMLLVTHSGADMQYKNTIMIEKNNKVSKIV